MSIQRGGPEAGGHPVVDAQVHLWGADSPGRPWRPDGHLYAHREGAFLAAELLEAMAGAGVDRAVLVPPSWEGDRNDVVSEAAARHPDRFAWLGRIDLAAPDGPRVLSELRARPGMRGVRLTFSHGPSASWLEDGTADWIWPLLERQGTPVMVFAPGRHRALEEVARLHPGLRLTVDHVGVGTEVRDAPIMPLVEPVAALARLPNVAVKATALPCLVSEPFPYPSLREPLLRLLEAFGPRRVFWGTDLTRLPCTYLEARLFAEELGVVSGPGRDWLYGRAISEWLGWEP
ncbi:MAG: amidohydrolase family protein [Candidatus Dormibacterales bacterium]